MPATAFSQNEAYLCGENHPGHPEANLVPDTVAEHPTSDSLEHQCEPHHGRYLDAAAVQQNKETGIYQSIHTHV